MREICFKLGQLPLHFYEFIVLYLYYLKELI